MSSKNIAVILAGGEGSRLRPLTYYFQKCMIPIGPRQKPLLEYIILNLRKHSLNDILISVGYKAEQIVNYFKDGRWYGVNIKYVYDKIDLKGTGGSLLNIFREGYLQDKQTIFIHYGDILSNIDLSDILRRYEESGADVMIALSSSYQLPVGVAEVDREGKIISFVEKPLIKIYVSVGILVLCSSVLHELDKLAIEGKSLDIMSDFIPYLIKIGKTVKAYITDAFWYDVGSIEKYEKLTNEMVEKYLSDLET
ncbi:MAG: nucleotidyltransferase family protein [Aigarchaeota archaeon]|nr:nucleotidyltransferase family protein [Aigarchaeota archaeon]MCX8193208.1 nucleotidyltransferase family protein [Nitrososphaeria archaeon]MDW7986349.1 nucleotidyltransferase family protein [Nitrososphaerota archaeon]